jgi:glycosyltransferase involved in cell wall biosynthesis
MNESPERVTLVLGTVAGGTGMHVKMLASGLVARGVGVAVAGPSSADTRFAFSAVPPVAFSAVEISDRPRAGDLVSILRLRRLLLQAGTGGPGGASSHAPGVSSRGASSRGGSLGAHVVHAHGMRAGALTVLALALVPGSRRPGVVVTVHNGPPGGGVTRLVYRVLERVVARGTDLVLCVSPDLERRMLAAGARRAERAVIAAPDTAPGPAAVPVAPAGIKSAGIAPAAVAPAGIKSAGIESAGIAPAAVEPAERPVVLAVGRLARQKGLDVLLEAAAAWRDLDPAPLVAIAGDGPLTGELRARAAELGVDALFLGRRDDVPALLRAAAVFVLPSRWEGQPLVLQEALRAGIPVVATLVGGVPCLTGEDAAVLVPVADARALAAAVRSVLTDAPLAARLRTAAAVRAATLPSEADAVSAALNAYASVRRAAGLR